MVLRACAIGVAWGSHVYYETIARATEKRAIALTRDAGHNGDRRNWKVGDDPRLAAACPGHHRYPVWWTGDNVPLMASVATMVDEGVHDFKPFVHSDCGGHGTPSDAALLRWTAHCSLGTIPRLQNLGAGSFSAPG